MTSFQTPVDTIRTQMHASETLAALNSAKEPVEKTQFETELAKQLLK